MPSIYLTISISFGCFYLSWHREKKSVFDLYGGWVMDFSQKIWILLILLRRHKTINVLKYSLPDASLYNDESVNLLFNPDCKISCGAYIYGGLCFFLCRLFFDWFWSRLLSKKKTKSENSIAMRSEKPKVVINRLKVNFFIIIMRYVLTTDCCGPVRIFKLWSAYFQLNQFFFELTSSKNTVQFG